MIERLTAHLEKEKEVYKEKLFRNTKLILLIKAIPNLTVFISLIKILFFHQTVLINMLVTPYLQNTEKVKCICVSKSNLYFSTDSFIIMKPLDQNEDTAMFLLLHVLYHTNQRSCFLHQKNTAFITGMD